MLVLLILAAQATAAAPPADIPPRVERLLKRAPIIDGHNDFAWELRKIGKPVEQIDLNDTTKLPTPLQTDIARLHRGHVGGQFWSVWIPAGTTGPEAVETTLEQIDVVRRFVAAHPRDFALATTADDMRRIARSGRVASLIGVEGGHQIDARLSVLRQYRALGVGYMTLTHTKSLDWADASTDAPRANGLNAFGRQVLREMNRLGMLVDISHVSDATARAAVAESAAPVIASHSGARAVADVPRNIPDDLLAAIAAKGGVVMVNFYPAFLATEWRAWDQARTAYAKSIGVSADSYGAKSPAPLVAWDASHPMPRVNVANVADHVDHVARMMGRDHVGLGGDFDGISGASPEGMSGVDSYPVLIAELARRGWSDAELAGLTQGNILRVMERAEAVAKAMAGDPPVDATGRN